MSTTKYTIWSENIVSEDSDSVSSKLAYLGQTSKLGIKIPSGLVLNFAAYERVFEIHWEKINALVASNKSKKPLDLLKELRSYTASNLEIPFDVLAEISNYQKHFPTNVKIQAVLRIDKNEIISFESTLGNLNQLGQNLLEAWQSFLKPNIFENILKLGDLKKVKIAILLSTKETPEVSGLAVVEKDFVQISAMWGELNPYSRMDQIDINQKENSFVYQAANQERQLTFINDNYQYLKVAKTFQSSQKLSEKDIENLVSILNKLQSRFLVNFSLKFEVEDGKITISEINVNESPILNKEPNSHLEVGLPLLEKARPFFPGIVSGISNYAQSLADIRKIRPGQIVVVDSLKKEYLNFLKKASGLIVRSGKDLNLARKLNIPTILDSSYKTSNQALTIDGGKGRIYKGSFTFKGVTIEPREEVILPSETKTATKIFVSAKSAAELLEVDFDNIGGIAPFTYESILAGKHPKKLFADQVSSKEVLKSLIDSLSAVCKLADEKPVVYQVSDHQSSLLSSLEGGKDYEEKEANPLIGHRGAEKYLMDNDVLNLELTAIKEVRNKLGLKNLWICFPFVRKVSELQELKKLLSSAGLPRSNSFKVMLSLDLPANIYQIDSFVEAGVDGILIDYPDLANLLYGKEFSLDELLNLEDKAMENGLEHVLTAVKKHKLFTGIYGLPTESKGELLKKLVSWGIKSVSVQADQVDNTRKILAKVENDVINRR